MSQFKCTTEMNYNSLFSTDYCRDVDDDSNGGSAAKRPQFLFGTHGQTSAEIMAATLLKKQQKPVQFAVPQAPSSSTPAAKATVMSPGSAFKFS